jgi:hypothetical protein
LLLIWTQVAWRSERKHARRLEAKAESRRNCDIASQVAAWVQRVTPALQESAALPQDRFRLTSWVLCIANGTSFGLYDWRVTGTVQPPLIEIDEGERRHGPIGPGGMVAVPLTTLDPAASPDVQLDIEFVDDRGERWRRNSQGLEEVSAATDGAGDPAITSAIT